MPIACARRISAPVFRRPGSRFRDFRSQRSLRRTVAALNRIGVRLPRRDRRSGLRWAAPCIGVRGRDGGGVRRGQERRLT